jgi:hypothetical protein
MLSRMHRAATVCILISIWPLVSYGHKDDYLNETFVYRTLEHGELELEYWFDYHELKPSGAGNYQHTLSAEYGFTNLWMADIALNYGNLESSNSYELSRWRLETRRRFGEEGSRTPDVALSLELEGEKSASEWDYQITPRIVLSHDFRAKLNTTLNLFVGIGVGHEAATAPGYNFGVRYPGEGVLRIGTEVIQTFDHTVASLIIPQIWILPWEEGVLKIGYAKAYGSQERYFLRVAFEAGI